jgi:undecaprenyl-diphosphatase
MQVAQQEIPQQVVEPERAWNLAWLTPLRCRAILAIVLAIGFVAHVWYLNHDCPIDLVGDEAQYWEWSRNLDLSYYSKGPLVAYIIHASCAIFGNTMPAVRYPALVLGAGTAIFTYLVTRKLFGSDRLALGAVLLGALVPVFVAGSLLMTIDPPMFFCWAGATYFATTAIFDEKRWAWAPVGVAIGIGFLAKYAALLWFAGLALFLLTSSRSPRSHGRKSVVTGALLAFAIALLFTIPVIYWNAKHDWVSFRHVARQTGTTGGALSHGNLPEMLGAQIGGINPILAGFMVAAIIYVTRHRSDPQRAKLLFLRCIGLTFFSLVTVISLFTKVQPNWPAPAYFTLLILTAYFLATRLARVEIRKHWRGWFWAMVVVGILAMPLLHDISIVFPLAQRFGIDPAKIDFAARARGWKMLGNVVSDELAALGSGAFVLCDDYAQAAEMAFYVRGQPKTYYAGSYYESDPKRLTQWDIWQDRRLDATSPLVGRNAVFVGKGGPLPVDVQRAFDRVEKLEPIPVVVRGATVKTFKLWRCYGFKGMRRSSDAKDF